MPKYKANIGWDGGVSGYWYGKKGVAVVTAKTETDALQIFKKKIAADAKTNRDRYPGDIENIEIEQVSSARNPTTKRARIAVLKSTTGYKDRAGTFHATGAAKKNPAAGFPVGKFVKVDAVKVNRNGTIDVMRPTSKRPKR